MASAELLTGLGIFKTLFDSAKGLKNINDTAIRNGAVVELQEKILAAQAQQTALVERVGELEKEVASLKAWDTEKQRYELKQWGHGAFAYVLKASEARGEPIHALCTACYDRGVRSRLQANGEQQWIKHAWDCPSCKFSLRAARGVLRDPSESI